MSRLPLALIIVVITSGCLNTNTTANPGLTIIMKPDLNKAYSNEDITIDVKISNTGTSPAQLINIELVGIDKNEWSLKTTCTNLIGKTFPPKTSLACAYKLKAPQLPEGMKQTYNLKLRMTYQYSTYSIASVTIGPPKEVRNSVTKKESSLSPVSIDIQARTPVRTSGSSVIFPIALTIKNAGNGVVCSTPTCPKDSWNKITIKISSSTSIALADCPPQKTLDLYIGKTNKMLCSLTTTSVQHKTEGLIFITSDYGYITEVQTPITVSNRAFD